MHRFWQKVCGYNHLGHVMFKVLLTKPRVKVKFELIIINYDKKVLFTEGLYHIMWFSIGKGTYTYAHKK